MSPKPGDKEAKALVLELKEFGKRNSKRFYILEDLSLAKGVCKTPEVRRFISERTREYFEELKLQEDTINKQIQRKVEAAAKSHGKIDKKEKNALDEVLEAVVHGAVKKEVIKKIGKSSKLKLKFKGLKKLPFVVFEMEK